jgi:hypothetical protein
MLCNAKYLVYRACALPIVKSSDVTVELLATGRPFMMLLPAGNMVRCPLERCIEPGENYYRDSDRDENVRAPRLRR